MNKGVAIVGSGRMGRGIALSYSFAGIPTLLVDLKQRTAEQREQYIADSIRELTKDLEFLASVNLIDTDQIESVQSKVSFTHRNADDSLTQYSMIYEAVPEVMDVKADAFSYISQHSHEEAIVASTTSTFLVTDLAPLVSKPERFLNAHWLNPAHLMPLVEISRSDGTAQKTVDTVIESLKSIGKETVICAATAGYIVPRIQALAMNEAARLVEEGVASAVDVDKAVNYGFGLRFGVLGLLEFIDWGGGDILYYGSKYLSQEIDPRYSSPDIVTKNMETGKGGLRDGEGFFNYADVDLDAYRQRRMQDFVAMLKHKNSLPKYNGGK